ncbi:unnamed protein product [Rhizoctonia solani]|uniref:Uncharacterized protein n=1 Tax=Rhizoctonia solani TaxID=456999 RepID=A0A8H2ZYS3_9AGAM|nr:unnamed protein product [Rhizoctonia solani]
MSTPATPSESNPTIVSRKVGAGIQARLAKLQGAAGTPVVTREAPRKFPNGYDDPFKERLDGTLRRSMSGTWSVAETSLTSDGSHTLVDSTVPSPSVQPVPLEDLKRRQVFTQNWEKEQQAVKQLASPEPPRVASSPQPIIELPEPDDELVPTPKVVSKPEPAPEKKDPKHGILTPPISEPEVPVVKKPEPAAVKPKISPKRVPRQPQGPARASSSTAPAPAKASSSSTPTQALSLTTPAQASSSTTPAQASSSITSPKVAKATTSSLLSPRTPIRRPRASAPPSTTLAPPVPAPAPRPYLTPSPARVSKSSSQPPRPHTSMTRRVFSSKIPDKIVPPPVRPRAVSKVYEGPTLSSLAKQRVPIGSRSPQSRAVSRADVFGPSETSAL